MAEANADDYVSLNVQYQLRCISEISQINMDILNNHILLSQALATQARGGLEWEIVRDSEVCDFNGENQLSVEVPLNINGGIQSQLPTNIRNRGPSLSRRRRRIAHPLLSSISSGEGNPSSFTPAVVTTIPGGIPKMVRSACNRPPFIAGPVPTNNVSSECANASQLQMEIAPLNQDGFRSSTTPNNTNNTPARRNVSPCSRSGQNEPSLNPSIGQAGVIQLQHYTAQPSRSNQLQDSKTNSYYPAPPAGALFRNNNCQSQSLSNPSKNSNSASGETHPMTLFPSSPWSSNPSQSEEYAPVASSFVRDNNISMKGGEAQQATVTPPPSVPSCQYTPKSGCNRIQISYTPINSNLSQQLSDSSRNSNLVSGETHPMTLFPSSPWSSNPSEPERFDPVPSSFVREISVDGELIQRSTITPPPSVCSCQNTHRSGCNQIQASYTPTSNYSHPLSNHSRNPNSVSGETHPMVLFPSSPWSSNPSQPDGYDPTASSFVRDDICVEGGGIEHSTMTPPPSVPSCQNTPRAVCNRVQASYTPTKNNGSQLLSNPSRNPNSVPARTYPMPISSWNSNISQTGENNPAISSCVRDTSLERGVIQRSTVPSYPNSPASGSNRFQNSSTAYYSPGLNSNLSQSLSNSSRNPDSSTAPCNSNPFQSGVNDPGLSPFAKYVSEQAGLIQYSTVPQFPNTPGLGYDELQNSYTAYYSPGPNSNPSQSLSNSSRNPNSSTCENFEFICPAGKYLSGLWNGSSSQSEGCNPWSSVYGQGGNTQLSTTPPSSSNQNSSKFWSELQDSSSTYCSPQPDSNISQTLSNSPRSPNCFITGGTSESLYSSSPCNTSSSDPVRYRKQRIATPPSTNQNCNEYRPYSSSTTYYSPEAYSELSQSHSDSSRNPNSSSRGYEPPAGRWNSSISQSESHDERASCRQSGVTQGSTIPPPPLSNESTFGSGSTLINFRLPDPIHLRYVSSGDSGNSNDLSRVNYLSENSKSTDSSVLPNSTMLSNIPYWSDIVSCNSSDDPRSQQQVGEGIDRESNALIDSNRDLIIDLQNLLHNLTVLRRRVESFRSTTSK